MHNFITCFCFIFAFSVQFHLEIPLPFCPPPYKHIIRYQDNNEFTFYRHRS